MVSFGDISGGRVAACHKWPSVYVAGLDLVGTLRRRWAAPSWYEEPNSKFRELSCRLFSGSVRCTSWGETSPQAREGGMYIVLDATHKIKRQRGIAPWA